MGLSKEAKENKPKKPSNAYFLFMKEKMPEFGEDVEDKRGKVT